MMLHEIGRELDAALRAQGYPSPGKVLDRQDFQPTAHRNAIVIEHDPDGGDAFGPVISQHVNPKQRMTRNIAAKITIYAKSSRAGAADFEHRRLAEHVLDLVLVAMGDVTAARKNTWTPTGGGFVTIPDLEGSERQGGAVYELTFTLGRGVFVQAFSGAIAAEANIGGVTSSTQVSRAHSTDPTPPVTACGA